MIRETKPQRLARLQLAIEQVCGRGQPCGCKAKETDDVLDRADRGRDSRCGSDGAVSVPGPAAEAMAVEERAVATAALDLAQFDQSIGGYTPPKATTRVRFPNIVQDLKGEA